MIRDTQQPILLVTDPARVEEVAKRLARVGFDHVVGYLDSGFAAWRDAGHVVDTVTRVSAAAVVAGDGPQTIVDVRKPDEFASGHLPGTENTPLAQLNDHLRELRSAQPFALHCASGYRSAIAASVLKSRGVHDFVEVEGGWKAMAEERVGAAA